MRGMLLAALTATLALGTALVADDAGLKALEGTYKVVGLTKSGDVVPDDVLKSVSVIFKADEMTLKLPERALPAKIKVDGKKSPMTIEITPSDGPEKGKTFLGIYRIEKDELTIAFNEKGDRPTEFKAEGDVALMKLKKDK